jgi:pimeloyl-ACP methyl ester carboxylesterase
MDTPASLFLPAADGLRLAAEQFGDAVNPVILMGHGGGQTGHIWADTARLLVEAGYCVITLDSRGHGKSDWADPPRYEPEDFARDFAEIARDRCEADGRRPHFVGSSKSGVAGLIAAGLIAPDAFATLTLVDVTPRFKSDALVKAQALFAKGHIEGFETVEHAARAMGARPERIEIERFVRRDVDGRWRWRFDPAFAERIHHNDQTRVRCEQAANAISIPFHLIRAGKSDFVDERTAEDLRAMAPQLRITVLPNARHVVTGDRDGAYARAIMAFIGGTPPSR